jgi:hypothetical protein
MTEFAKFNEDVLFGRSGGKILWQPRIGCWYYDKRFAGEPLPAPYTGRNLPEIYRLLGCSDHLYDWYNPCFERIEDERVRFERKNLNERERETIITTPAGAQRAVDRFSPNSTHLYHLKWEVTTEEELEVAAWREEHATWRWNQEAFDRAQAEVGDLGTPTIYLPRMNVQSIYLDKMGVENGVYALHDWPDRVEAYFRALEVSDGRLLDVVNASPVNIINMGENVHAGTLSPDLFERYHLPACRRRCEKLHGSGKFVYAHWDGDCRPLLPFARETLLDGIEAITPEPQGDVTLAEVKQALGDDIFLFDGIPAIYFDSTYSEAQLVACVHEIIELFAPKLILGISDELTSTGDIERIRVVGRIVDEYNASCA